MYRYCRSAARIRARLAFEFGDACTPGFCRSSVDSILSSDHPFLILECINLDDIPSLSLHSAEHNVSPLNVIIRFLRVFLACCTGVAQRRLPKTYPLSFFMRSRLFPGGGSPTCA